MYACQESTDPMAQPSPAFPPPPGGVLRSPQLGVTPTPGSPVSGTYHRQAPAARPWGDLLDAASGRRGSVGSVGSDHSSWNGDGGLFAFSLDRSRPASQAAASSTGLSSGTQSPATQFSAPQQQQHQQQQQSDLSLQPFGDKHPFSDVIPGERCLHFTLQSYHCRR